MPGAIHRSIFTRLQSGGPSRDPSSSHSRSLSSSPLLANTTTITTITTTTTFPSSSSEPLLHSASSDPVTVTPNSYHYDPVSRQTRHDDNDAVLAPLSPWADAPTHGNFEAEKGSSGRRRRKTRRRYGPIIVFLLELIMGSWSIYATIRYFVTLAQYEEPSVQTLLLALGASSIVSSLSIFSCLLLASFGSRRSRLLFGPYHPAFPTLLSLLRIVSYLCLLGPAIVSFTFVFIWRASPDPNLNLTSRCHLDVDAVWTISTNVCADSAPPWAVWVALASGRLAITFAIIAIYHTITVLLPSSMRKHGHRHTSDIPSFRDNKTTAASLAPIGRRQSSDLTLDATLVGESPHLHFSRKHLGHSRSSEISKEGLASEALSPPQRSSTLGAEIDGDATAAGFVDRFRALITQINREMESALDIARSERTSSIFTTTEDRAHSPSSSSHDAESLQHHSNEYCYDPVYDDDNGGHNVFSLPPLPPSLGYNEFGLPYPPDESVPMLNGFIRRMPTIESMGSGEMATTSLASSSRPATTGSGTGVDGVHQSTRARRNTLLSTTTTTASSASNHGTTPGSNFPSRSNSLVSQAQQQQPGQGEVAINPTTTTPRIGPNTSEFGELLDSKIDGRRQRLSGAPSISVGSQSSAASYHTAGMDGSYSPTTDGFAQPTFT